MMDYLSPSIPRILSLFFIPLDNFSVCFSLAFAFYHPSYDFESANKSGNIKRHQETWKVHHWNKYTTKTKEGIKIIQYTHQLEGEEELFHDSFSKVRTETGVPCHLWEVFTSCCWCLYLGGSMFSKTTFLQPFLFFQYLDYAKKFSSQLTFDT